MKGLVKAIEGLPKIVKIIGIILWSVLTNIYRLARSVAKGNVLGIILAIILLICGGFGILLIIDLVCVIINKPIIWID